MFPKVALWSSLAPARLFAVTLFGFALQAHAANLDIAPDAVLGQADFVSINPGPAGAANIISVYGVAEDPLTGALWVSTGPGNRVLRFSSAAAFANGEAANVVLGQANFVSTAVNRGGAVAANTMSFPVGVAVDQAGRLYVGDGANNRVLVFRPPFSIGMNASSVIGQADFVSNTCNRGLAAPASNTLCGPSGVVLDRTGTLFVADSFNNRVLRFNAPAATGAAATKVWGQGGSFTTSGSATTAGGLNAPYQLALDATGNLWVADKNNNRVLRFDDAAAGDTTADLVLCQSNFTTATTGRTASTCDDPMGVSVDTEGVVHVTDYFNNRILRFVAPSTGAAATSVIGQPNFTSGSCNQALASPTATSLCEPRTSGHDRSGNLLVGDSRNGRVLRYDLPRPRVLPTIASLSPQSVPQAGGAFVLTVNGTGFYQGSTVNVNGTSRSTQFLSDKRLLAQIPAADIAAAGPHAITVTNPSPGGGSSALLQLVSYTRAALDASADRVLGQPNLVTATSLNPQVGEEQLGTQGASNASASTLIHAAVDKVSGRLFVADANTASRVASWPSVSAFYNGQPADVIFGQPDEFSSGCNKGGLSASTLCQPYAVAVDSAGALYVADLANNRVVKYVPPFSTGMAATRVFGQGGVFTTDIANNGGISALSLSGPRGLAVNDVALFVFDSNNRRILVYNSPNTDLAADAAIGQSDLVSGISSTPSASRITGSDAGLVLDAAGRLYFANRSLNRVLRFSPPFASDMAADLVLGQADFAATAAATTATGLRSPIGVALDPAGNLLVAEFSNHRVVRYAAPFTNGMAATGILGQADFTSLSSGLSASKFSSPLGVAVDAVGNVIVTDFGNARVLAFDRPFAFALDPAGDIDRDGIPNGIETVEGRDAYTKDNDLFALGAPGPRLFAMQQYRDFLSREGDAGGITFWTNLVTSGAQSRAQAIQGFFTSPEFQGVIAPVARLYFANFLRYPDYVGLQYHVARSRTGTPLDVIATDFATSPEFVSRYGALTNDAFIELVYQNVLGRPSDPGGKAYWLSQMAGGASRGQVMLGFSESPEYVAAIGNEVFITMMYVGMLKRAPDAVGFPYWLAQLDGGTSSLALTQGFLDAPEYRGRFLP